MTAEQSGGGSTGAGSNGINRESSISPLLSPDPTNIPAHNTHSNNNSPNYHQSASAANSPALLPVPAANTHLVPTANISPSHPTQTITQNRSVSPNQLGHGGHPFGMRSGSPNDEVKRLIHEESPMRARRNTSASNLDNISDLARSVKRTNSVQLPNMRKKPPMVFVTSEAALKVMNEERRQKIMDAQRRWRNFKLAFHVTRILMKLLKDRRLYGTKNVIAVGEVKAGRIFFDPTNRLYVLWEFLLFLCIMFNIVAAPIHMGFQHGEQLAISIIVLSVFTDVVFYLDMFVSSHLGYFQDGVLIRDEQLIKRRYKRRAFLSDLVSQTPMDYIALIAGADAAIVGTLRLTRSTYMRKLPKLFNDWEKSIRFNPIVVRFVKLGLWIAILAHFVACVWYRIGYSGIKQFPPTGWLVLDGLTLADSLGYRYERSYYWSMQTLATVGYGDIRPVTESELFFCILVMIIGQGIYAVIIGNMSSLIADADSLGTQFSKKLDSIRAYMRYRKLPDSLRNKISAYYEYVEMEHKSVDESQVFAELPLALKSEIMSVQVENFLYNTILFADVDRTFMAHLVQNLHPVIFSPGDVIVSENEFDAGMFIITRGSLELIVGPLDSGRVVGTLGTGAVFGELSLLEKTRCKYTIKTVSFCDGFVLNAESFMEICDIFPDVNLNILGAMEKRSQTVFNLEDSPPSFSPRSDTLSGRNKYLLH